MASAAAKRRDKVGTVENIQPVRQQLCGQTPPFEPVMRRRPQRGMPRTGADSFVAGHFPAVKDSQVDRGILQALNRIDEPRDVGADSADSIVGQPRVDANSQGAHKRAV